MILKTLNNSKKMENTDRNPAFDLPLEPPDPNDAEINNRCKRHHPNTKFEEFCACNPSSEECRIYE